MTAVGALWRSSHPGPTLVVSTLALVLGFSAGLDAARLALLVGAVFAGQLSVGWCNDAVDARRDVAVGRRDKPIVRGEIAAHTVGSAAGVAVAAALAASAALGAGFLAAHAVALASAWAYNLGIKLTAASAVPFVVSFGLFPSLATLALPAPTLAAPWATVAGGALGVAVHFSNVLPDLDDDSATGVRGLPHRLGARTSAVVAFAAVGVGAAVVALGGLLVGGAAGAGRDGAAGAGAASVVVAAAGVVTVGAICVVGVRRALRHPDRVVFRLVMLAALVLVAQLALTGVSVAPPG